MYKWTTRFTHLHCGYSSNTQHVTSWQQKLVKMVSELCRQCTHRSRCSKGSTPNTCKL